MEHLPTVIVAVIVAAIFVAIVVKNIINIKKGKGGCSCNCEGCSLNCHGSKTENK
ncbi:MAG: FeoB-associated Cys-rich membrane protein [Clostridia bacterium]|nr:FeoB-associated Cys-rich membrane protein [Clostridia bacterium]